MKKQFSLFLILILIAGCSDTVDNSLETINFHKGTEGLTMEIVNNLPPEDIWKNSEFQIGIKLENKGPVEIKSGSITISGLDPRYSFSDEYTKDFSLNARSYDYPEGDQKIISFNVKNTGVPVGSDEYAAAFTARAYYDYGTEASVNVCINPNIYSYINTVDDACEVQDIADTEGQGSPIAVTKVEERISPISENSGSIEIEFKLTLENLGKGEVVDKIKVDDKEYEVDSHYVLIDHGTTKEIAIELFDKNDKDFQLRYFDDQVESTLDFYELQEIMYLKRPVKKIEW